MLWKCPVNSQLFNNTIFSRPGCMCGGVRVRVGAASPLLGREQLRTATFIRVRISFPYITTVGLSPLQEDFMEGEDVPAPSKKELELA